MGTSAGKEPQTRETTISCESLPNFQAEVTFTPLLGHEPNLILVTIQSIEGQARQQLHCDALTGLPDRRELANQRARWRQNSPHQPIPHAALFLDLDGFKKINDQHGHALGDRVLQVLSERWQQCIREPDLLVRYGGDEFVILLSGVRERKEIEPIISRLTAATAQPIELDSLLLHVTATIGGAMAEDTSVALEQLLEEADCDMYAMKNKAVNR